MQSIPLAPLARQSFEVTLNGQLWALRIYQVSDTRMAMDVDIGTREIVRGVRCIPGVPVLQYDYLRREFGDLAWGTVGDALPWWQDFGGLSCELLYATPGELGYV